MNYCVSSEVFDMHIDQERLEIAHDYGVRYTAVILVGCTWVVVFDDLTTETEPASIDMLVF